MNQVIGIAIKCVVAAGYVTGLEVAELSGDRLRVELTDGTSIVVKDNDCLYTEDPVLAYSRVQRQKAIQEQALEVERKAMLAQAMQERASEAANALRQAARAPQSMPKRLRGEDESTRVPKSERTEPESHRGGHYNLNAEIHKAEAQLRKEDRREPQSAREAGIPALSPVVPVPGQEGFGEHEWCWVDGYEVRHCFYDSMATCLAHMHKQPRDSYSYCTNRAYAPYHVPVQVPQEGV